MVDSALIQHKTMIASNRNPSAKWCDGALVLDALLDAIYIFIAAGLQRMVLKSIQHEHESEHLSQFYSCIQIAKYTSTLFTEKNEKGCWKTTAKESRAHCEV